MGALEIMFDRLQERIKKASREELEYMEKRLFALLELVRKRLGK